MLSKNVNNKKCAPKLIFFNEKRIERDSDDFWHRKLTLNVQFWHFLTPLVLRIWVIPLVSPSRPKIKWFTLSILILRQKPLQFCTLRLKSSQPVKMKKVSLYYVSTRLGGWVQIIAIYTDIQNSIYDRRWPWVGQKES